MHKGFQPLTELDQRLLFYHRTSVKSLLQRQRFAVASRFLVLLPQEAVHLDFWVDASACGNSWGL